MTTTPAGYVQLKGSERRPAPGTSLLGPADPGEQFSVTIVLRRRLDGEPMPSTDFYARTPPSQRPRLSEDEFAARYGASPEDMAAVTGFAAASGLTVIEANAARRSVKVSGTVAQMQRAFGVSLGVYQIGGSTADTGRAAARTYRGRDGFIFAPAALAEVVIGVFGLDNRPITKHNNNGDPSNTGELTVPTITGLYNFPTNSAAGQTIAIVSGGGYDTSTGSGNDFAQYFATLPGYAVPDIIAVPPAASANNLGPDSETTQDICIAATVAQHATIAVYFLSYFAEGQNQWHDLIERVITPDTGDFPAGVNPPSVLSSSFYICDGDDLGTLTNEHVTSSFIQAVHMAFQDAARQNITVCIAAGDQGSDSKVGSQTGINEWNEVTEGFNYNFAPDNQAHVQYPGSDPYVLSCGGTTVGNVSGSSFDEYVWNDINPDGEGGLVTTWATGGGVSDFFTESSSFTADYGYQDGVSVPTSVNDGHAGRGVPDVVGNASGNSGYPYFVGGQSSVMSGTSAVAPLYAGLVAVINASLGGENVGFLNPILYLLGNSVCRDIDAPPGPVSNSINGIKGYSAAVGWDACTGWGVIDGLALQSALQTVFQQSVSLILDRSTFGKDEVTASLSGGSATFTDAIYVVIDGLHPDQIGLNSGNLTAPPNLATLIAFDGSFPALPGVSLVFDAATGVQLEDPTDFFAVQRMTFPYNVTFTQADGALPAFSGITNPPGFADYLLSVAVNTTAIAPYRPVSLSSSIAEVELVLQADPYMIAGETWWLSNDMRVFTVTPATLAAGQAPLEYSTTPWGPDPNTYITNLISELNTGFTSPTTTNTPFNAIPYGEDQSALLLSENDTNGNPVFNFALARIRLQGDTAMNVRVFFRLFISTSPDTDYDPSTTFRSAAETDASGSQIAGTLIPLLGFPSSDMPSTIPFFAAPRISSTSEDMTRQPDPANVQQIPSPSIPSPPPPGEPVLAYFGCWLDINQPTPQFPLDPQATSAPDGPYSPSEILPIPAIIMGNHACLVAQIAYDPDPIPPGANAATSDKIGQRNLSWGSSDNPGPAKAHLVPTLFDIRPTAAKLPPGSRPDELMIEWGDTPAGTVASLYWPQVDADDVLALADRYYTASRLSKGDAHTIQCVTGTVTYIPIPPGAGPNIAGLLSLQLPQAVLVGQEFNVVIRRLSSRSAYILDAGDGDAAGDSAREPTLNWRYVVGAFQIRIPVATARSLLPAEESVLAVYKWKLEQIPKANRWHPVVQRFVTQVSGRVSGLGGNPVAIGPSQLGTPGSAHGRPPERREFTGKVSNMDFDRFGNFTGFRILTESGADMSFHATEETVGHLIRDAWVHRWVITVIVDAHGGIHWPAAFILRRSERD